MDEAILDIVLQIRIAAHCSSIRPHNLAFSVARSPNQGVFRMAIPRRMVLSLLYPRGYILLASNSNLDLNQVFITKPKEKDI